jgi:hypothetical protein
MRDLTHRLKHLPREAAFVREISIATLRAALAAVQERAAAIKQRPTADSAEVMRCAAIRSAPA